MHKTVRFTSPKSHDGGNVEYPKKVRLKRTRSGYLGPNQRDFNTKKVRLKLQRPRKTCRQTYNFNTKKVRLKRAPRLSRRRPRLHYFNTKKVRLKQSRRFRAGTGCAGFQYQKGAIKTNQNCSNDCSNDGFQYQKGAIKTLLQLFFEPFSSFISIPKRCD